MKTISIYHSSLKGGGGVCTFTKNLIISLSNHYNITLHIKDVTIKIIKELNQYCNITTITKNIVTDFFISSQNHDNIPHNIKASKIIKIVHADFNYSKNEYNHDDRITHIVAVSKHNAEVFKKRYNKEVDKIIPNLYNPNIPQYPKKENEILSLITVSRISKEKGFQRMIDLSNKINTPFRWDVYGKGNKHYTDSILKQKHNLTFHGYTNNPYQKIAKADYLVQLSDTEGMPYAIIEALQQRTPVVTTNYPSAKELITDGFNGYIIDMDLTNWDKILQNKIKLTNFEPIVDVRHWINLL